MSEETTKNNDLLKSIEEQIRKKREEENYGKKNFALTVSLGKKEKVDEPVEIMSEKKKALFIGILVLLYVGLFLAIVFIDFSEFGHRTTVSSTINIESLKKESKLEVLSVSVSEMIFDSKDTNKDGAEIWTEYTGTGVYTIDLSKSQFLVDELRKVVVVRTPPVVINQDTFTLNYRDTSIKFFKNTFANDSYRDGVDLAQRQLSTAYVKIYNKLYTNPYYYQTAENAAERIIASLVKGLNKDTDGLEVYVEIGDI